MPQMACGRRKGLHNNYYSANNVFTKGNRRRSIGTGEPNRSLCRVRTRVPVLLSLYVCARYAQVRSAEICISHGVSGDRYRGTLSRANVYHAYPRDFSLPHGVLCGRARKSLRACCRRNVSLFFCVYVVFLIAIKENDSYFRRKPSSLCFRRIRDWTRHVWSVIFVRTAIAPMRFFDSRLVVHCIFEHYLLSDYNRAYVHSAHVIDLFAVRAV